MTRVKLYILNDNRQWDDKGKGYVSVVACPSVANGVSGSSPDMMLVMKSEANPDVTLLESKIHVETQYAKQQDTLIVWNEEASGELAISQSISPGSLIDLALSFEEVKGCSAIFDQICAIQGDSFDSRSDGSASESEPDTSRDTLNDSANSLPGSKGQQPTTDVFKTLLNINELENLSWYVDRYFQSNMEKEALANALESDNLIPRMLDLFAKCEDLEHAKGLESLYSVFKFFISLGKTSVYEILFSDIHIDNVIGVLENAPNKPHQAHRDFIQNASLKQPMAIKNPKLLSKIKQTYKVQYIHDVILPTPPVMEDMNLYTLQSYIFLNKAEIVCLIQEDRDFLKSTISLITDQESSYEEKKNALGFLKELCAYSQSLEVIKREALFLMMLDLQILNVVSTILAIDEEEEESRLQWAAVEVLAYFIEVCPLLVRQFILTDHQTNDSNDEALLINLLLEQLLRDKDPQLGGAMQIYNLFRILLDFSDADQTDLNLDKSVDPKDRFLSMFYSRTMPTLMAPILAATSDGDNLSRDDYRFALLSQTIIRMLTFCLGHGHTYHIRNYLLKNDLIGRVLLLMKSKHTFAVLAALNFVRTIVGLKDDTYVRHIIANKLLQAIVDTYSRNGHTYNLLNSALIEFFEFIRSENMKSLISHYGEFYAANFEEVDYVETFKNLKIRYTQSTEVPVNAAQIDVSTESLADTVLLSPAEQLFTTGDEEDWLNSEDDHAPNSLLDENPDDERWNVQFDYHASQLAQKKRVSVAKNGSDSSIFETVPLQRSSLTINKDKKLNLKFNSDVISAIKDEDEPVKATETTNSILSVLAPVKPPTPLGSLVAYEADSDNSDEESSSPTKSKPDPSPDSTEIPETITEPESTEVPETISDTEPLEVNEEVSTTECSEVPETVSAPDSVDVSETSDPPSNTSEAAAAETPEVVKEEGTTDSNDTSPSSTTDEQAISQSDDTFSEPPSKKLRQTDEV